MIPVILVGLGGLRSWLCQMCGSLFAAMVFEEKTLALKWMDGLGGGGP